MASFWLLLRDHEDLLSSDIARGTYLVGCPLLGHLLTYSVVPVRLDGEREHLAVPPLQQLKRRQLLALTSSTIQTRRQVTSPMTSIAVTKMRKPHCEAVSDED